MKNDIKYKDIGIFSFGRKGSFRVKNKLLKKFGNTTLTDIVLKKLKKFNKQSFFAGYDTEFEEKCSFHKIRFVKRDYKSSTIDTPITSILHFLKKQGYKKFIIINACVPFLKISTIKKFIKFCLEQPNRPAFTIVKKNNLYLNNNYKPINFNKNLKTINTKKVKEIYEFAHCLYYFDKDFFFVNKRYWNYNNLRYFEIKNKYEQIDIDTNEDFLIAKKLWLNDYR
jgi:CMP-N-acetylneuraminic acid synthetase